MYIHHAMQTKRRAHLAFGLLGLIWGTNFAFMKMGVAVISPLQVVWLRVVAGALPLFVYAAARGSLRLAHLRHAHHFVVMALLANVLPFYFLVKGTQVLKAGVAGIISGSIPLITAVLAMTCVAEEHLTRRRAAGIGLGFVGVLLVAEAWTKASSLGAGLRGESFIVIAAISYAGAFVYAKKFVAATAVPPVALATYQTLSASVLLTLVTDSRGAADLLAHRSALWAVVLGLGVLGTGLAYLLYYAIIDELGAVVASSVTYIPPVVALAVGALWLGDDVSPFQLGGTAMILAGIYFARGTPRHEAAYAPEARVARA
jgi:drug/metabolite transporter (DMT)-like permease